MCEVSTARVAEAATWRNAQTKSAGSCIAMAAFHAES